MVAAPFVGSIEHWALTAPDAPALSDGTRTVSYAEWNRQSDRLAELLADRGGVSFGSRIAVCMYNRIEWFVAQWAAAKLGAELVPISFRLTPAEVHYIVADCSARAFLFDTEDLEGISRVWTNRPATTRPSAVEIAISLTPTHRADVLTFADAVRGEAKSARFAQRPPRSIVYTSGTTGRPRGVVHTRNPSPSAAARARPRSSAAATSPSSALLRNLLGAPLCHAAGQASAAATHQLGGCVYILPRFDAEQALSIIDSEKITTSFFVPTMLTRIVALPEAVRARYDVSSIQRITTGASPCPQAIKAQVIEYFGNHCLVESYGTTEVGLVSRMMPEDHLRKPGSCGRVLEGVDVQIRDDRGQVLGPGELGEIYVRTPVMIERYLNEAPPEELASGFFATGDIGRFDDDGFLYVLDRKKDMIISGGVNIYPAEVEEALRAHPAVQDVAVFGIPHPEWGEQVKAVVERAPGQPVTLAELLAFVSDRLAAYKQPRSIEFVAEIPRNPAGKVLKAELREAHWAGTGRHI